MYVVQALDIGKCIRWDGIQQASKVAMQIHFVLFRRTMLKHVTDVKVFPGEEVSLQH